MTFERVDTTANRLKEAMDAAGMKQIDVVRKTGIDKGSLSHYLKGRYEPKQEVIYKLAKTLDVNEMWLWGYDCEMKRSIEQKNNDTITDIIVKMRTHEDFLEVVNVLYNLDEDKLKSVKQFLRTFI